MKVDSEGVSWFGRPSMQPVLSILREVRDPRAPNARHELSAILFIALAATLCGQKSCVHIADFGAVNAAELAEIVELPHGAPSHDCFSRVFRLLDPAELAKALASFVGAIRDGLDLGAPRGIVAVDGKSLRKAYERGRACAPPLMVSVWDAETRVDPGPERLHRHGRCPSLSSADGRRCAGQRCRLCAGPEGQPRPAPCRGGERIRAGRRQGLPSVL